MLWGNTAYCVKLSGEDLSRYSNKIELAALRKCPYYYHYLTKKVTSQQKHFSDLVPHHGGKTGYGMKKLRHRHPTRSEDSFHVLNVEHL